MSRIIKVEDGSYTIKVEAGQNIILDTRRDTLTAGKVEVRGDLEVSGITTSIESTDTVITDNLITLNDGQVGAGISSSKTWYNFSNTAGFEIDRGSRAKAALLFDENLNWYKGGDSGLGTFSFVDQTGQLLPLYTNGIQSEGSLFINTGPGIIDVTNSINYEKNIFYYDPLTDLIAVNPETGNVSYDDDRIPNTKAIEDYFFYSLTQIGTSILRDQDTYIEARDETTTGLPSNISVAIDNKNVLGIYHDRVEFEGLRVQNNMISSHISNEDLILDAPGSGVVAVNDVLEIKEGPYIDDNSLLAASTDGVRMFAQEPSYGKTGIFYINKNNITDEIISTNRSLLFSMLF